MDALFGVLGFLTIIVGLIMLIIGAFRRKGKKIAGIVAGVGLVFFIIGVSLGSNKPAPTSIPSTPASTQITQSKSAATPTQSSYSIGQNIAVGSGRWTVLSAKDRGSILRASESKYSFASKDKTTSGKFIEVTLEIENVGKITETYVSSPLLIDGKGREYKAATDVYAWIPTDKEFSGGLQPGVPKQAVLIYEVPQDATQLKLQARDISFGGTQKALIDLGL